MGASNSNNQNGYYVNIKGLKRDVGIKFEMKPFGSTKEDKPEIYDTMSGDLVKIKIGTGEYEGKQYAKIWFHLKDKGEIFIISSAFTNISRSIINSLLSYQEGFVSIYVYNNKEGFSSVSVKCDEERLDWFFTIDEMNTHVYEVETDDGKQKQFGKLNNFLIEKLNEKLIPMLDAKSEAKEQEKDMISEQDAEEINAANKDIKQDPTNDSSDTIVEDEKDLPF